MKTLRIFQIVLNFKLSLMHHSQGGEGVKIFNPEGVVYILCKGCYRLWCIEPKWPYSCIR